MREGRGAQGGKESRAEWQCEASVSARPGNRVVVRAGPACSASAAGPRGSAGQAANARATLTVLTMHAWPSGQSTLGD